MKTSKNNSKSVLVLFSLVIAFALQQSKGFSATQLPNLVITNIAPIVEENRVVVKISNIGLGRIPESSLPYRVKATQGDQIKAVSVNKRISPAGEIEVSIPLLNMTTEQITVFVDSSKKIREANETDNTSVYTFDIYNPELSSTLYAGLDNYLQFDSGDKFNYIIQPVKIALQNTSNEKVTAQIYMPFSASEWDHVGEVPTVESISAEGFDVTLNPNFDGVNDTKLLAEDVSLNRLSPDSSDSLIVVRAQIRIKRPTTYKKSIYTTVTSQITYNKNMPGEESQGNSFTFRTPVPVQIRPISVALKNTTTGADAGEIILWVEEELEGQSMYVRIGDGFVKNLPANMKFNTLVTTSDGSRREYVNGDSMTTNSVGSYDFPVATSLTYGNNLYRTDKENLNKLILSNHGIVGDNYTVYAEGTVNY